MNTRIASFLSALLIVGASGCASTSHKAPEAAESYAPVATYPIGGAGGWDFLSVPGPGHRRYVSRGDHVQRVAPPAGTMCGSLTATAGVPSRATPGTTAYA